MDTQDGRSVNEEKLQEIMQHLQNKDAQKRIHNNMQNARSKFTVTISRASALFDFSEQQLRDWEKHGLLKTERQTVPAKEQGRFVKGHRQYAPGELEKLAVIKELIDKAGFLPGEIPPTIADIWQSISKASEEQLDAEYQAQVIQIGENGYEHLSINERFERARTKLFWRYFVSHALRLSLSLICEENPGTIVGLVLPLQKVDVASIDNVEDLSKLGESLIGWLTLDNSFSIILTLRPSFQYHTDFRLHRLQVMNTGEPQKDVSLESTFVIVQREAKSITLSREVVDVIRLLLKPLYEDTESLRMCFGRNMYDVLEPSPEISNTTINPDILLTGFANMTVRLGGKVGERDRWRFCCILLPEDLSLPLHQRNLVVRAQSQDLPYQVGVAFVSPGKDDLNSLSLRAYQSGHVVYRSIHSSEDSAIAFYDVEKTERSVIAIPIGAEYGAPSAVLYVASREMIFSETEKRLLRIMSRIVDELLSTFGARLREVENLRKLIQAPDIVDEQFGIFKSENDFIDDLEDLLGRIKEYLNEPNKYASFEKPTTADTIEIELPSVDGVSFIAVDVDNLGELAAKYGNQMVRNLCKEVGQRILGELESTFKKYKGCQCYHIYADRFYILLRSVPLEQVYEKAILLKKSLDGPYKVSIHQTTAKLPPQPGTLEDLNITVRIAVSSFNYETLKELLQPFPIDVAVPRVRLTVDRSLAKELKKGMAKGGNVIMAWNPEVRRHELLSLID